MLQCVAVRSSLDNVFLSCVLQCVAAWVHASIDNSCISYVLQCVAVYSSKTTPAHRGVHFHAVHMSTTAANHMWCSVMWSKEPDILTTKPYILSKELNITRLCTCRQQLHVMCGAVCCSTLAKGQQLHFMCVAVCYSALVNRQQLHIMCGAVCWVCCKHSSIDNTCISRGAFSCMFTSLHPTSPNSCGVPRLSRNDHFDLMDDARIRDGVWVGTVSSRQNRVT